MDDERHPPHLKAPEEIEKTSISGLVEVLREEGIDTVRYVLWDVTVWHRDYSPPAWRNRATEEQKRVGWGMAARIEKIPCTVLHEVRERQVEETRDTLAEGSEGLYKATWTELGGCDPLLPEPSERCSVSENRSAKVVPRALPIC